MLSREHKYMIKQASVKDIENQHKKQFREWFESNVSSIYMEIIIIVLYA